MELIEDVTDISIYIVQNSILTGSQKCSQTLITLFANFNHMIKEI